MKSLLSSRVLFALGFLLIAATDIVALAGVAFNRSGNPQAQVTLTERELRLPYRLHKENSGLSLHLVWRALGEDKDHDAYAANWQSPAWFDDKKLEALGFDVGSYLRDDDLFLGKERTPIPKQAFIVLEYNGDAYAEALKRAEIAFEKGKNAFNASENPDDRTREYFKRVDKRLKRERITESRLFAVDAGLDFEKLKQKYPDPTRFVIAKGIVKLIRHYSNRRKTVSGFIEELSVEYIHIPRTHRQILDALVDQVPSESNEFRAPRYQVELVYGRRLEPWIVSVRQCNGSAHP